MAAEPRYPYIAKGDQVVLALANGRPQVGTVLDNARAPDGNVRAIYLQSPDPSQPAEAVSWRMVLAWRKAVAGEAPRIEVPPGLVVPLAGPAGPNGHAPLPGGWDDTCPPGTMARTPHDHDRCMATWPAGAR